MLLFLAETNLEHASGDKDRETLYKMVKDLKNSRKEGIRYMKQFELLDMYLEEGIDLGMKVVKQHNSGHTAKEIAEELNISVERVDDIIQKYENA